MPDPIKKQFKLPALKLPALSRKVLVIILAAVVAVVIAGVGAKIWLLNANLKSSTKIMQGLRDEVDLLLRENQSHVEQALQEKSERESMSTEITSLKAENVSSTERQGELQAKVEEAEKTLEEQSKTAAVLERRLKESNERMRRQRNTSDSLGERSRSARSNPAMTPEYVKLVESEWLSANAKTEELKKDLDKTLKALSGQNQERTQLLSETATMHYNLAVILTQQENYPAAIREYEKVLETRPDDADTHYNLAILYDDRMKNNLKALDHYRQYIRLSPASPESPRVAEWIQKKEFDLALKK